MKTRTTKTGYRTRNWSQYNQSLAERGSLTIWVEQGVGTTWYNQTLSGRRGASEIYSEAAITCCLMLGIVFSQPLRQTTGLARSIFALMGLDLVIPHWSTLSRRRDNLDISLGAVPRQGSHIVIDSTGLKVYGQGEWHVRQHGVSKRRKWRKLHIGVDEQTGEIVAAMATLSQMADAPILPDLLEQIPVGLEQVSADGAYDSFACHEQIALKGARSVIPPRRGARIKQHDNRSGTPLARNEIVREIALYGRAGWKRQSGYHRRSLVETAMSRLKGILGERLTARRFEGQSSEMMLRCAVLNRMTQLGMPITEAIS